MSSPAITIPRYRIATDGKRFRIERLVKRRSLFKVFYLWEPMGRRLCGIGPFVVSYYDKLGAAKYQIERLKDRDRENEARAWRVVIEGGKA